MSVEYDELAQVAPSYVVAMVNAVVDNDRLDLLVELADNLQESLYEWYACNSPSHPFYQWLEATRWYAPLTYAISKAQDMLLTKYPYPTKAHHQILVRR